MESIMESIRILLEVNCLEQINYQALHRLLALPIRSSEEEAGP